MWLQNGQSTQRLYSFITSFEPSLSGFMAKEFKFGLIRANNRSAVDESFVFADVLE